MRICLKIKIVKSVEGLLLWIVIIFIDRIVNKERVGVNFERVCSM